MHRYVKGFVWRVTEGEKHYLIGESSRTWTESGPWSGLLSWDQADLWRQSFFFFFNLSNSHICCHKVTPVLSPSSPPLPWCRVKVIIPPPLPHPSISQGPLSFPSSLVGIFPMFVNCVLLFAPPAPPPTSLSLFLRLPCFSPSSPSLLCLPCSSVLSNSH